MTESIVLAVFAAMLVAGIAAGVPIVWILVAGLALFSGYALKQGHSVREVAHMAGSGMKSVRDILILYLIVGMMCAAWRASGTIPYTVSVCAGLMTPGIFILMTFLACCLMSTLMGTSTGTAATMGVICMTIASAMGADKVLTGGAILAGSFFGDRMSPMSGSALLVAGLTKTEVTKNVLRMAKTAALRAHLPHLCSLRLHDAARLLDAADGIHLLPLVPHGLDPCHSCPCNRRPLAHARSRQEDDACSARACLHHLRRCSGRGTSGSSRPPHLRLYVDGPHDRLDA